MASVVHENEAGLTKQLLASQDALKQEQGEVVMLKNALGQKTTLLFEANNNLSRMEEEATQVQARYEEEVSNMKVLLSGAMAEASNTKKALAEEDVALQDAREELLQASDRMGQEQAQLTLQQDQVQELTASLKEIQGSVEASKAGMSALEDAEACGSAERSHIIGILQRLAQEHATVMEMYAARKAESDTEANKREPDSQAVQDAVHLAQEQLEMARQEAKQAKEQLEMARQEAKQAQDQLKMARQEAKDSQKFANELQERVKAEATRADQAESKVALCQKVKHSEQPTRCQEDDNVQLVTLQSALEDQVKDFESRMATLLSSSSSC